MHFNYKNVHAVDKHTSIQVPGPIMTG